MENDSRNELLDFIKLNRDPKYEQLDRKKLRYVIYARKSTTNEDRQERSIPDQIHECIERIVKPQQLTVVQIVEEKQSAKFPDQRSLFTKMLDELKAGKIDGIIAWHPNRLSRNMKEAGEIIDLIDKNVIKDLQFPTFSFERTSSGMMMLGMNFVLSKEYSDSLSTSVSRGNKSRTENDGAYLGKQKHGYFITNGERHLLPDSSLPLIEQAFEKRFAGESLESISEWLNKSNYSLRKYGKAEPVKITWDKDAVSKLFKDSVYAGILTYGKYAVDLVEKYDFSPIISVKQYMQLNNIDLSKMVKDTKIRSQSKNRNANLLRGCVICGHCGKAFTSSLTSKKRKDGTVWYYNYKCDTKDCLFRGKSVRAHVIINFVIDFFTANSFIEKEHYNWYKKQSKAIAKKAVENQRLELNRLNGSLSQLLGRYQDTKALIVDKPELLDVYKQDLELMKSSIDQAERELSYLKSDIVQSESRVLEFSKFIELFVMLPVSIKKTTRMAVLDDTIKFFFSNFIVKDNGKVSKQRYEITYKLKEPWDGFLKHEKVLDGRGERTRTFDLTVPNRAR